MLVSLYLSYSDLFVSDDLPQFFLGAVIVQVQLLDLTGEVTLLTR